MKKPRTHQVLSDDQARAWPIGGDELIEIVTTFKRRPADDRLRQFEAGTFFIRHDDRRFSAAVIVKNQNWKGCAA